VCDGSRRRKLATVLPRLRRGWVSGACAGEEIRLRDAQMTTNERIRRVVREVRTTNTTGKSLRVLSVKGDTSPTLQVLPQHLTTGGRTPSHRAVRHSPAPLPFSLAAQTRKNTSLVATPIPPLSRGEVTERRLQDRYCGKAGLWHAGDHGRRTAAWDMVPVGKWVD